MRNNMTPRPSVGTRRAAPEPTGVVTCYRGVRPNNNPNNSNNNIHATLAEYFQPSSLHKLRQLDLYIKTDKPDSGHQLHAGAVAEVAYTKTST